MKRHLTEHGYVVVKEVAGSHEIAEATDLLWKFLEEKNLMKRGEPETWK